MRRQQKVSAHLWASEAWLPMRLLQATGLVPVGVDDAGFKSNYYDVATGEYYGISGCKRRGSNRLYGERIPVEIDEEVWREYWTQIRNQPQKQRERYADM